MAEQDHDAAYETIQALIAENEDLKRQVAFYKGAYEEQLRNSLTLADALEARKDEESEGE